MSALPPSPFPAQRRRILPTPARLGMDWIANMLGAWGNFNRRFIQLRHSAIPDDHREYMLDLSWGINGDFEVRLDAWITVFKQPDPRSRRIAQIYVNQAWRFRQFVETIIQTEQPRLTPEWLRTMLIMNNNFLTTVTIVFVRWRAFITHPRELLGPVR